MFRRKKKIEGIFEDLPEAPKDIKPRQDQARRSGRRAMLIPDEPYNDDPGADKLLANTGKQKEVWLELIFNSEVR
ncbi:MAG: hypothetical protein EBR26_07045, partial [Microbacteriaceae bacterium]|nr:hypothetical protein [Microbacteriaceae bacterium]